MIPNKQQNIVFLSNGITPYGIHFLKRIAEELLDIRLKTIFSYEFSMGQWSLNIPDCINAVILGREEKSNDQLSVISFKNSFKRYKQIVDEITAHVPVAVIILGYGNLAHYLTIEWCKKNKIHCLIAADSNILGDTNNSFKSFFKYLIVHRIVSRCSALLPCGNLGAQYFKKYGAKSNHIFFSPVEPDYSLIASISLALIESVRLEYKINLNRHYIIYSGRLVAVKRIDLLLDAFMIIAKDRPEWDLLIAGAGPLEAELKSKVPINLQQRILWIGFIDSPQNMFALYRLSDVLALTSDYEPWALVVNEAASVGLALVCSDIVGAAAELLHDRENGRFFEKGDVSSLVDALRDVTDIENLSRYRANSAHILDNWKKDADPVIGLRRALEFCFKTSLVNSLTRRQKYSKISK